MSTRLHALERFAPLTGIVFVALLVVSIVLGGDTPDVDESTAQVVEFWSDNEDDQVASAVVGALAAVFFLWFVGSLRSALRLAEGLTGRLSAIAFAGGLIIVVGGIVNSSIQFAAADSVGDVPPEVTQTISTLYDGFWIPFPVGIGTLFLATGILALRSRVLPAWLGGLTLLLGILALTPIGFFVFFAFLVWVVLLSTLMFLGRLVVPDSVAPAGTAAPLPPAGTAPPPPPPATTPPPPPPPVT